LFNQAPPVLPRRCPDENPFEFIDVNLTEQFTDVHEEEKKTDALKRSRDQLDMDLSRREGPRSDLMEGSTIAWTQQQQRMQSAIGKAGLPVGPKAHIAPQSVPSGPAPRSPRARPKSPQALVQTIHENSKNLNNPFSFAFE